MQTVFFWTLIAFLVGSIPFAVLLGRFLLKKDIRQVGDGNPGGANAWKAGGWKVGLLASLLELSKGFFPVYLARSAGLSGWSLVPVCLAPILGHAYSPFLRFKGGKALGATAGVWMALIGYWVFPVFAILTLPVLALQEEHALAANAGMFSLLAFAILFDKTPPMIVFALLNCLVVAWKHRRELQRPLQFRPWLGNLIGRRTA